MVKATGRANKHAAVSLACLPRILLTRPSAEATALTSACAKQVAATGALILACSMVSQYRAQRARASAPHVGDGGPVELLQFEMLHDPACAAETHCRSACRMVCDEIHSGQGSPEHAATLISFGCCLSAPIISKQQGVPVRLEQRQQRQGTSPLELMVKGQAAQEEMLFQVNARGHIKFDRPADIRKDSIAVHVLRDRHSLAADLKDLELEQTALAKRVRKLKLQDVLPFKSSHFKVAKGQALGYVAPVERGIPERVGYAIKGYDVGKLYPEGPGSTDPYYDEVDKLPFEWDEPECDLPNILKGKVNCTEGKKRAITGLDPYSVERQITPDGKFKGQDFEQDSSYKEYDKFRKYLQAANRYGLTGNFKRPGLEANPNLYYNQHPKYFTRHTGVEDFGTAWEDSEPHQWCGNFPNGSFQLNAYECYRNCHWHAVQLKDEDLKQECIKSLNYNDKQYEWIHKPGCKVNVTINHTFWQATPRFFAGVDYDADPPEEDEGAEEGKDASAVDAAASCLELIPVRTWNDYGHAVANGSFSMEDMEAEMDKVTPSNDAIKAYLGDDLFHEYEEEEQEHLPNSQAHMRLQIGQHRIRKLANFKKAFGNKTEFEWCLEQHKGDPDFPKACTGDGKTFEGKPWQARHKQLTAPEAALEGVAYAFRSLVGEDHREAVVDQTQTEAAGQTHTNKFEYGSVTVQPGHVSGEHAIAPWLRTKGLREVPQTYEGKSALAHEQSKLPGITIDSWGGGLPMTHHSIRSPLSYSPSSCCAHFVEYSEWA